MLKQPTFWRKLSCGAYRNDKKPSLKPDRDAWAQMADKISNLLFE